MWPSDIPNFDGSAAEHEGQAIGVMACGIEIRAATRTVGRLDKPCAVTGDTRVVGFNGVGRVVLRMHVRRGGVILQNGWMSSANSSNPPNRDFILTFLAP